MSGPHEGKIAVVTGAAGGLGAEVALRLAAGGARIACGDVAPDGLAQTVEAVRERGGEAVGHQVDITSEEAVARWRASIHEELGRPSMLLNIAGILSRTQLADTDLEAFMRVLEVNAGGGFACARAFVPDMVEGGWGRIVNIGSIAAVTGYPYPAYGSSKAAVVNLTRSLLIDLWGTGITANAVCPGAMDTPMMQHSAATQMRARTPANRIVTPAEMAGVVDFLCTEGAACVNGATLVVDGGATAVFRYFED